ncbi:MULTISPECIES: hypothetical protein [Lactococcus]|uniref:hypothetical protein n=1 Tax=Lactococcus TaxID=1357 RepID=UPI00035D2157|nr:MULTISPECIES: hypothetical protein [Lactococcus]MCG3097715.1 hypothetical protein [Lactococcus petauri]
MRKYITNLYGQSEQSTAMTAQHMITKLAQDEGFKEISISAYSVSEDTAEEKEKKNLWYAVICYARRFGHCSNAILEWHRI